MANRRRWTDEQLREAVATSKSFAEVQRKLGLVGGFYIVTRKTRELGLDTGHFAKKSLARPGSWTDEQVRSAVASSTSFTSALKKLGKEPGLGDQRLRAHMAALNVDASHFKRRGTTSWTDETLRSAVATSRSYAEAIRKLGLIPAGGNYDAVRRRIDALALDTSHMTGKGWSRGRRVERAALPLEKVLVAGRWVASDTLKKRLFKAGLKHAACEICGWAERAPDGRIPVELDHINGDKNDNRIENLRILCPNCHSLQPTHRGLNKRSHRKKQKQT